MIIKLLLLKYVTVKIRMFCLSFQATTWPFLWVQLGHNVFTKLIWSGATPCSMSDKARSWLVCVSKSRRQPTSTPVTASDTVSNLNDVISSAEPFIHKHYEIELTAVSQTEERLSIKPLIRNQRVHCVLLLNPPSSLRERRPRTVQLTKHIWTTLMEVKLSFSKRVVQF